MSNTAPELRRLGEEPFGHRLYRARRASGIELRDAAERISGFMFTSHSRLHRLEKLDEAPPDPARRALAYLAMLAYGFDPAELGLSNEDLPRQLRLDGLEDILNSRKSWVGVAAPMMAVPLSVPA